MTYTELIKHFGTQQEAADALGVTQGAVSEWGRNIKGIPDTRQYHIQFVTGGVLQADPIKRKRKAA